MKRCKDLKNHERLKSLRRSIRKNLLRQNKKTENGCLKLVNYQRKIRGRTVQSHGSQNHWRYFEPANHHARTHYEDKDCGAIDRGLNKYDLSTWDAGVQWSSVLGNGTWIDKLRDKTNIEIPICFFCKYHEWNFSFKKLIL